MRQRMIASITVTRLVERKIRVKYGSRSSVDATTAKNPMLTVEKQVAMTAASRKEYRLSLYILFVT